MQRLLCWIVLGVLLASPGAVIAQLTDKSVALDEVGTRAKTDHVPGQVIIKFKERFREEAVVDMAADTRMAHVKPIKGVKADLFSIPEETDMEAMILKIRSDPRVAYVEPDYYLWPTATPNDPFFPLQWGLHNSGQEVLGRRGTPGADIKATGAWDITQGSRDVIVAIIDTGVEIFHPDIAPNLWYNITELQGAGSIGNWRPNGIDDDGNGYVDDVVGWDFFYNSNNPRDLSSGHGTHVAGIAAAAGNNGIGVAGVSWRSRIMPLAVQDYATGNLPISAIAGALIYAQRMGAHVVNLSLGAYGTSQTLQDAVNQTTNPVICAAAGNDGRNNDTSQHIPSNYTNANLIAVAATGPTDALASFSNFGKNNVDVAAPGVNILSTYITGSGYTYLNGTSMATPMVAGIAALLRSQWPGVSAVQVVSIIKNNVDPVGALANKVSTGGRVNAAKALHQATDGDDGGGGGCFIKTLRLESVDSSGPL